MGAKLCRRGGRIVVCLMLLSYLMGCQAHDDAYYRSHPHALFAELKSCMSKHLPDLPCQHLNVLAEAFHHLAQALRHDPQAFGQHMMTLESRCSNSMLSLTEKDKCRRNLELRYAVVKWFESPEN